METQEALELVRSEIARAGAAMSLNYVTVGICRRKDNGHLFMSISGHEAYCRTEIVYRSNGTKANTSIRIKFHGYDDKFSAGLTEKTIRAKVAKAVSAWNAYVASENMLGPYFYKKDKSLGKLAEWYDVVGSYAVGFETGMLDFDGETWNKYKWPLLVRAYRETGAVYHGYEKALEEAVKA